MSRDSRYRSASLFDETAAVAAPSRPAPGRATLTQRLVRGAAAAAAPASRAPTLDPAAQVQRRRAQDADLAIAMGVAPAARDDDGVRAVAAQGVAGGGGALPHADAIQRSFGAHDISGVRAHVGGAAASAADALGAEAYATGSSVAFRESPSLFVAAHEAAHVVQQRAGVHFSGAVGRAGDVYERHADQVAERVVAGESAEELLAAGAHGATSAPVVQRKEAPKPSKADEKKATDQFEADGPRVVYALAGVFRDSKAMMDYMPSRYDGALQKLLRVVHGDGPPGKRVALDGRARAALLAEVFPTFEPFALANAHFGGPSDHLPAMMANLHWAVARDEASDRVDNAIVVGDGKDRKAMEMPDEGHPREQAAVLKVTIPKLIGTINATIEHAHEIGEMAGVSDKILEKLAGAKEVLSFADSYLELSDKEFQEKLQHIHGVMNGVATYSDLVHHVLEIGSGAVSLTCTASALLMKAVGDHEMAETCELAGKGVTGALGKVVAAVEIVHSVAVLFDRSSSTDDRIGAGVAIAGAVSSFAVGSSLPIMGPYALIKGAQYLLSGATIGWETDLVRGEFKIMQEAAISIGQGMQSLAAAQLLLQQEHDAGRRAAMAEEEKARAHGLMGTLVSFLHKTEHREQGSDIYTPGYNQILSDAFAGQRARAAGVTSDDQIVAFAHEVTKQMVWCFDRAAGIIHATAANKTIVEVEAYQRQSEHDAKE